LTKLIVKVGVFSNYRDTFWRMAKPAFKTGDIDTIIHVSLVAHHMISYAREAEAGFQTAAFYSPKLRKTA
jgi:hopanoid C-2 methylase